VKLKVCIVPCIEWAASPAGMKSFCPNSYDFHTKLCTTMAYESSVTT